MCRTYNEDPAQLLIWINRRAPRVRRAAGAEKIVSRPEEADGRGIVDQPLGERGKTISPHSTAGIGSLLTAASRKAVQTMACMARGAVPHL
jgi:hypothetical protein